jgi:hypothetical protein
VRPEAVRLGDGGEGEGPYVTLAARVVMNEPLGGETHVLLDAAGTRLRARTPGFGAPPPGTEVKVRVSVPAVLWFDAETGKRVRPSG